MSNTSILSKVTMSAEESVDPKPEYFTITAQAIRVGHGNEIFPLRNITRVGKYYFKMRFPIVLIVICIGIGLISLLMGNLPIAGGQFTVFGFLMLGLAAFGIWQRQQPGTAVFGFECSSGDVRYFRAKEEQFIDRALCVITEFLESGENASYHFDFRNNSVTTIGGTVSGTIISGDQS